MKSAMKGLRRGLAGENDQGEGLLKVVRGGAGPEGH